MATKLVFRSQPICHSHSPVLNCISIFVASGPMVLWNQHERGIPKGIQVGKTGSSTVLHIPHEFDSVKHYGVDCELITVEVSE